MPKSDTWPGGVTMEPSSNLDSAGSCDSVISMNSGNYSEDSMEHLSAEERACLMYLEETIEALEVQEDSGFSNDEPDPGSQAGSGGQIRNDVSSFKADESDPESGSRVSTIEDEGLDQTPEPQPESSNADGRVRPSATELCVSTDGNGHLKIVPSASLCQTNEACDGGLDVIPPPVDFMDEPGQIVRLLPPSAGISNGKPAIDLEQLRQRASGKRTSVDQVPLNKPPNLSLPAVTSDPLMTPPPDEPRSPPTVAPKPKRLPANIILKSHKVTVGFPDPSEHSVPSGRDRLSLDPQRIRIEALRKLGLLPAGAGSLSPKLSPKTRRSWAAPPSPMSPGAPQTPPSPSYSRVHSSPPACLPPQSPAAPPACLPPQSPAAPPACLPPQSPAAPPACLPPQSPAAPPACLPPQSPAAPSPPACLPPQSPAAPPACLPPQSPAAPPACLPPQSPAAPSPPACLPPQSPAAPPACLPPQSPVAPPACLPPQTSVAPPACLPPQPPSPPACLPPQPPAAPPACLPPQPPVAPPACLPPQPPSPPACLPPQPPAAPPPPAGDPVEVLPAPAAFSDPVGPPPSYDEARVHAGVNTPPLTPLTPLTPPSLAKRLTPPKGVGVKSATLERSGLGLSSSLTDQDSIKIGQLRKTRARPASLGGGTEFTNAAGGEVSLAGHAAAATKEPDLRRLLPTHNALQHSRDSQKLPRSQGISVLICPRSENGEDRREALRKLGLLRD